MPEALRKPFKEQGARTTKAAFRYAMICGVVIRFVAFLLRTRMHEIQRNMLLRNRKNTTTAKSTKKTQ
jgi:hypothetical protein